MAKNRTKIIIGVISVAAIAAILYYIFVHRPSALAQKAIYVTNIDRVCQQQCAKNESESRALDDEEKGQVCDEKCDLRRRAAIIDQCQLDCGYVGQFDTPEKIVTAATSMCKDHCGQNCLREAVKSGKPADLLGCIGVCKDVCFIPGDFAQGGAETPTDYDNLFACQDSCSGKCIQDAKDKGLTPDAKYCGNVCRDGCTKIVAHCQLDCGQQCVLDAKERGVKPNWGECARTCKQQCSGPAVKMVENAAMSSNVEQFRYLEKRQTFRRK